MPAFVKLKAMLLVMVLLPMLTLVLSAFGSDDEAEKHFNAGVKLHQQGRLEEAKLFFHDAEAGLVEYLTAGVPVLGAISVRIHASACRV